MLHFLAAIAWISNPTSARGVDVAYAARYYYQGRRRSYSHLYLCRHDGRGRMQITFGSKNTLAPIWIDRNHLAYTEICGTSASRWPVNGPLNNYRIYIYNMLTGKQRLLKDLGAHISVWTNKGNYIVTDEAGEGAGTSSAWRPTLNGFKRVEKTWAREFFARSPLVLGKGGNATTLTWDVRQGLDRDSKPNLALKLTKGSKMKTLSLPADQVEQAFAVNEGLVIVTCPGWMKYDAAHHIYFVNTKTWQAKPLVSTSAS